MIDMTKGRPLGLLWRFAVPLILSALFQQLYTLADSMIVGRLLGPEVFAAIGSAGYLYGFPSSMLGGMAHGFAVVLAQRRGAGENAGFRRALAGGRALVLAFGAGMLVALLPGLPWLLALVKTPEAMVAPGREYLLVMLLGLPLCALSHMNTAALNAAGDSRTPFLAGLLANLLNIALDLTLVARLGLGAWGIAASTVVAQGLCALLCRRMLKNAALLPRGDRPTRQDLAALLKMGLPPLTSCGVNALGEVAVQSVLNSQGVRFVAGLLAARRYYSLLSVAGYGLEGAMGTFGGQNTGAGKLLRVRRGLWDAIWSGSLLAAAIAVPVWCFGDQMILLFLPQAGPEILAVGRAVLRIDSIGMASLCLLVVCRVAIQSMGNSVIPMLSGFAELGMRLACAFALPLLFGPPGLMYIEAINWTVVGAGMAVCFGWVWRKKQAISEIVNGQLTIHPPQIRI